jgi:hypothetical protein
MHYCSTLSEFENFLLCEWILINVTTFQNETLILKILSNLKPLGLVEQINVVFNSFLCKLSFFGTRGPLNLAHSCQKKAQFTHELVK